MANLDRLFRKFNDTITISNSKRENLKKSRDALREDIMDWFADHDKLMPAFHGQGSYAMRTLINPINGIDYDIDDGIYIKGYADEDITSWPVPATVHAWIKDAVEDRTLAGATDKDTCIRVKYATGYHVDIPVYIIKSREAYLSHKSKGWFVSDPKAFTKWFIDKIGDETLYGEQLRSVVKYLKAWKDYTGNPLKGIEITILASESFVKYEGRDDKSLRDTVQNIINKVEYNFHCYKPVEPFEDLFEDASKKRQSDIVDGLKSLYDNLEKAIKETDEKTASEIVRDKLFGTRFPIGSPTRTYAATSAPGVLKSDGRSA